MQQYSAAQFSRNAASHQSRPQQQPKLARQAFSSELRHKDIGSGDLASAMSLPTSSGTEGRVGAEGGPRGPNKRKGGRSRKAPPSDSQAMQRCLDVVEQLLEEEDAEPFAEPVSSTALHVTLHHIPHMSLSAPPMRLAGAHWPHSIACCKGFAPFYECTTQSQRQIGIEQDQYAGRCSSAGAA